MGYEYQVGNSRSAIATLQPISSMVVKSASPITGRFVSVNVPQVAVGQDIKATIDYRATNPGAFLWKTFLVADSPALNLRKVIDDTVETLWEGGRKKTYILGKMPNKDVNITFYLFAHDNWTYDWKWAEYEAFLDGYAIKMTYLATEYKFLSIGEIPDGDDIPPDYKLVYSYQYPLASTYSGKAALGTSTFRIQLPDQIIWPKGWVTGKIVSEFEKQVNKQGQRMLDIKIYQDSTATWHTDYIIKSICTDSSPFPWAIVIPLVLGIILAIAIINLVVTWEKIDWNAIPSPIIDAIPIIGVVIGLGILTSVVIAGRKK